MTEEELSREVRRLIERCGLYGYHNPDSRRCAPGWPDWVILGRRPPGVMWRELKSPFGVLSPDQRHVAWMLQHSGQDWDVWRPLDYETGRIRAQLEAFAG